MQGFFKKIKKRGQPEGHPLFVKTYLNRCLFVLCQHVLDAVGSHTAVNLVTDFDDRSQTASADAAEAGQ